MRARKTWNVRRWSQAGWIDPLPRIRNEYGDEIADIVEVHAHMLASARDEPSWQDIKATLNAIQQSPETTSLAHLDPTSNALLIGEAVRRRIAQGLRELSASDLASCAATALGRLPNRTGRPRTALRSANLVADLLSVCEGWTVPQRNRLIADALRAVKLGASNEAVARAVRAARRLRLRGSFLT
jgi:hypothetical protein